VKTLRNILKHKGLCFCTLLIVFMYLNNSSLFTEKNDEKPILLAHRGLAQTFSMEGITNETNTAQRMNVPEHPYLENTIPSMEAAFKYGADIVELDVQLTKDGQFAVFHDWLLEYRTNGKGNVSDYTMKELKVLDIGYQYTADGGKSFPFRGKGTRLMPTLDEVLTHFEDQSFLIHIKSNKAKDGERLAAYLKGFTNERLKSLAVYGGDEPISVLQKQLPNIRVMSKATLMKALVTYELLGWTGYVPAACRNTELHIPLKYAPYLWGWPYKFLERMERVNTQAIIVQGDGKFSEGFDKIEDLNNLPSHFTGGIWTNRIDKIGPLFDGKKD
jgi:glycerophosphoryl diester phosphodiesterase